eukprot:1832939-Rhodomonas_salina.1
MARVLPPRPIPKVPRRVRRSAASGAKKQLKNNVVPYKLYQECGLFTPSAWPQVQRPMSQRPEIKSQPRTAGTKRRQHVLDLIGFCAGCALFGTETAWLVLPESKVSLQL